MKSQRPYTKALMCLVLFLIVASLDYVSGYEVTSFPLYLAPIMIAFFYFGKPGGYVAVVVATIVWFTNDILTGHTYQVEAIRYWNAGARLVIYGLFVYALSTYTRTVEAGRRRLEELRRLLPICHACGQIMGKDGTWKTPKEILEAASDIWEIPECPSCRVDEPQAPGS